MSTPEEFENVEEASVNEITSISRRHRFQKVFCPNKNENPTGVFKFLGFEKHFRIALFSWRIIVWTVGLTVEIKLRLKFLRHIVVKRALCSFVSIYSSLWQHRGYRPLSACYRHLERPWCSPYSVWLDHWLYGNLLCTTERKQSRNLYVRRHAFLTIEVESGRGALEK